jgi:DMSO/TMAO reductase YedYZ molybdopterin-dependent catalytic subunit
MSRLIRGIVSGLISALVALGVAELVAAISSSFRSPVIDVGNRVVDLVPVSVKNLAIEWFGTNDKTALLIGIAVILAVYAAVVGVVALRGHLRLGVAGIALFGVVGAYAALSGREERGFLAILPSVIGAIAGSAALVVLARAAAHTAGDASVAASTIDATAEPAVAQSSDGADTGDRQEGVPSRRAFLAAGAGLAAAGVAAGVAGRWLGERFSAVASRASVVLPRARRPLAPAPSSIEVGTKGVTPFFTKNSDFYRIDTALQVPQVQVADWKLKVTGMVDTPIELTFEQLLARDLDEYDITLTCVSNEVGGQLMGTARWLGLRLDTLLKEAGVSPDADQVVGRSVDGYTCGFPTKVLDGRNAMVAVGMNGEPLPLEHGFPARLIVPGLYGYVSATKWLTEIELTRFDRFDQYWVPRGYAVQAPIKPSSRIDTPRGLERIKPGRTAVGGVAWAQPVGITGVEVQVDDGPWQPARLADALNDVTWRQWTFPWDATSGQHTLTVRATDGTGAIQTADRSEPLPNGASGHHRIVVLVDS